MRQNVKLSSGSTEDSADDLVVLCALGGRCNECHQVFTLSFDFFLFLFRFLVEFIELDELYTFSM